MGLVIVGDIRLLISRLTGVSCQRQCHTFIYQRGSRIMVTSCWSLPVERLGQLCDPQTVFIRVCIMLPEVDRRQNGQLKFSHFSGIGFTLGTGLVLSDCWM